MSLRTPSFIVAASLIVALCFASCAACYEDIDEMPHVRDEKGLHPIQQEMLPFVEDMLEHAVDSYLSYAFPHDDLKPLTASYGKGDIIGGLNVTLIDMLDTVALMNRPKLFRRLARWVEEHVDFRRAYNVSVYDANARIVGGLLGAHYVYEEGIVPVEPEEHDYQGGLLRLAAQLASRMLLVFNTTTGVPHRAFSYRRGALGGREQPLTNTDTAGTYMMEFAALSKVTGNPKYETAARRASQTLYDLREPLSSMMPSKINITSGIWARSESSIGAISGTLEHFLKTHILSGEADQWNKFEATHMISNLYMRKGGMYRDVPVRRPMKRDVNWEGSASHFPSLLVQGGHRTEATENVWTSQAILRWFGVMPDTGKDKYDYFTSDEGKYQLRPEHIESIYQMYRATRDPVYLEMGKEFALALHLRTRTAASYATLSSVSSPSYRTRMNDKMDSVLIAGTLKYLYLLFDECNVLHLQSTVGGRIPDECLDDAERAREAGSSPHSRVGWVFSSQGHLFPNHGEWWDAPPAEVPVPAPETAAEEKEVAKPKKKKLQKEASSVPKWNTTTSAALYYLGAAQSARQALRDESLVDKRVRHLRGMLITVAEEMALLGEKMATKDVFKNAGLTPEPMYGKLTAMDYRRQVEDTLRYKYYCRNHLTTEVDRLGPLVFRLGVSSV